MIAVKSRPLQDSSPSFTLNFSRNDNRKTFSNLPVTDSYYSGAIKTEITQRNLSPPKPAPVVEKKVSYEYKGS